MLHSSTDFRLTAGAVSEAARLAVVLRVHTSQKYGFEGNVLLR